MNDPARLTRRRLLGGAAAAGFSSVVANSSLSALAKPLANAARRPIPLPSPAQVRADFQTMVDFGPRLTGSDSHNRFIGWLEREFTTAGLNLLPCDVYETERWLAQQVGLDVLEGSPAGPVKLASYYPRSQETPAGGVTGPLVYGGTAPAPSLNGADPGALAAALARYPADLASWASGLSGTVAGGTQGSILLVDLPMPVPATTAIFLSATYLNWPGHTEGDWATGDYKRVWIEPGLGVPLAPFQATGAAGVVFVVDASYEALAGAYAPFGHGFEPLPALYVDRDTGARLRTQAMARPRARLTLTATRQKVPTPSVTAVLPGAGEETIIFNTHTDGQGFAEENGGVAFVQLARYFGSLPKARRLKRTLVFAAWPGHMAADLPQAQGWIDAHPDLVKRAAAALTVEHLGCSEWNDSTDKGYHRTGEAEAFGIWTTQGKMQELTRDTVVAHGIPHAALLRPPVQFGVGGAFQSAGVPQIGAIAGPEYLVTISANGDMDKLDESLAAKQIAWLADLTTQLDAVPADELRQGDPTLGVGAPGGSASDQHKQQPCAPAAEGSAVAGGPPKLVVRYRGLRHKAHGMVVQLSTDHGTLEDLTVELHRSGRIVARAHAKRVTAAGQRVVLHRPHGRRFPAGRATLVVRRRQKRLAVRPVRIG